VEFVTIILQPEKAQMTREGTFGSASRVCAICGEEMLDGSSCRCGGVEHLVTGFAVDAGETSLSVAELGSAEWA